jgi:hypothetical protein
MHEVVYGNGKGAEVWHEERFYAVAEALRPVPRLRGR